EIASCCHWFRRSDTAHSQIADGIEGCERQAPAIRDQASVLGLIIERVERPDAVRIRAGENRELRTIWWRRSRRGKDIGFRTGIGRLERLGDDATVRRQ